MQNMLLLDNQSFIWFEKWKKKSIVPLRHLSMNYMHGCWTIGFPVLIKVGNSYPQGAHRGPTDVMTPWQSPEC